MLTPLTVNGVNIDGSSNKIAVGAWVDYVERFPVRDICSDKVVPLQYVYTGADLCNRTPPAANSPMSPTFIEYLGAMTRHPIEYLLCMGDAVACFGCECCCGMDAKEFRPCDPRLHGLIVNFLELRFEVGLRLW